MTRSNTAAASSPDVDDQRDYAEEAANQELLDNPDPDPPTTGENYVRDLKPAVATEGETEEEKGERQKAIRAAYSAAMKRLREENLDEFNRLHKEEAAELGYDWSPRPTAEEKAAAELERLLAEHPGLAERLAKRD